MADGALRHASARHPRVARGHRAVRPGLLSPAPTRSTACRSASSPSTPGTACSRATCSSSPAGDGAPAPEFTIIDAPELQGRSRAPRHRGSDVVIALNFAERLVLIGGTSYAGEIKKSVFTILNYLLPLRGVLSMHCSANIGAAGDVALFFGLSGTGKTTLSSDPDRRLIGDDEHGWSDRGVFNFEGGCYAKTIRLSAEAEPQIYATTRRFGTVLENVVVDPRRRRELDLDDDRFTENTRAAYPISFIDNAEPSGQGGHPTNIVMLTADAFGVLPPISRLTPDGGDVSLPVRLHREGGGHREGRHRAARRRSAPVSARRFCRCRPAATRRCSASGSRRHRARVWLVNTGWTRRALRRRVAHEDPVHARDDSRRARRRARRRAVRARSDLQRRRADGVSRRARRGPASRARRGATPRRTTSRRRSSRGCSPTTSRRSRPTCRRRSAPPARAPR